MFGIFDFRRVVRRLVLTFGYLRWGRTVLCSLLYPRVFRHASRGGLCFVVCLGCQRGAPRAFFMFGFTP